LTRNRIGLDSGDATEKTIGLKAADGCDRPPRDRHFARNRSPIGVAARADDHFKPARGHGLDENVVPTEILRPLTNRTLYCLFYATRHEIRLQAFRECQTKALDA
jgi:hypothetical protein